VAFKPLKRTASGQELTIIQSASGGGLHLDAHGLRDGHRFSHQRDKNAPYFTNGQQFSQGRAGDHPQGIDAGVDNQFGVELS